MEHTGSCFDIYQKIDKAHRKYSQTKLSKYGFTPNEIIVIMFLHNNAPGLDTATDIARLKGISKGMIARSVESLCQKNYIEAVRDLNDRRIVHLSLKDENHLITEEIDQTQKEFFKKIENGISTEEFKYTKDTLGKLLANAEQLLDGRL